MAQEFNFRIRIVMHGKDEISESEIINFIMCELGTGGYSADNPIIDENKDCDIEYVEVD